MSMEDFEEYCARHEVLSPRRELQEGEMRHQELLDRIYERPSIVRVGEPEAKFMEVPLYRDSGRDLGAIDLVFFMPDRDVCIIEVKSSVCETKNATRQLDRYYGYVWSRFGILPRRVKMIKRKSRGGFAVHVRKPDQIHIDIFKRTQTLNDR